MIDLYLSLGSNLGDRRASLETALERLDAAFKPARRTLSSIIETEAWGFDGEPFLNMAVRFSIPRTGQSPEAQALDILKIIKSIEKEMGRCETIEYDDSGDRVYHSRPIDIDILFFGTHTMDLPELKIPHPLIPERDFVKVPLREIAGPTLKKSFSSLFIK